jgi:hypothetical protein
MDSIDAISATGRTYLAGGDDGDIVLGSEFADEIYGDLGDDTLVGYGGDDKIVGDDGFDEIHGGAGNDDLQGGVGDDTIWSGLGGADQPYNGIVPPGGTAGWRDVRHMGGDDCDLEDDHLDMDPGCPPLGAVDDYYNGFANQDIVDTAPGVTANDLPGLYDAILVDDVAFGMLDFNTDGSFTYTPNTNFSGIDEFTYKVSDGVAESNVATVTLEVYGGQPLMLDAPPVVTPPCGCGSKTKGVSPPPVAIVAEKALDRWAQAGVDQETLSALAASIVVEVIDLPGSTLGMVASDGRVLIDINAAGHGWFIDATPQTDEEFERIVSRSQREATGGAAMERADLLSVVMHEIGHALGLEHDHGNATNVMNDTIGLGTRRSPTAWDAAIVDWLYWTGRRRR